MKKVKPIKIKAVFLLMAFSLNSIIGFACAIGLNMGFKSHCHDEEKSTITECVYCHSVLKHNHVENIIEHHQTKNTENCCHDHVVKITQADKVVPQSFSISDKSFLLNTSLLNPYNIALLNSLKDSHIRNFTGFHHPPIKDIRTAIKSFQI